MGLSLSTKPQCLCRREDSTSKSGGPKPLVEDTGQTEVAPQGGQPAIEPALPSDGPAVSQPSSVEVGPASHVGQQRDPALGAPSMEMGCRV